MGEFWLTFFRSSARDSSVSSSELATIPVAIPALREPLLVAKRHKAARRSTEEARR